MIHSLCCAWGISIARGYVWHRWSDSKGSRADSIHRITGPHVCRRCCLHHGVLLNCLTAACMNFQFWLCTFFCSEPTDKPSRVTLVFQVYATGTSSMGCSFRSGVERGGLDSWIIDILIICLSNRRRRSKNGSGCNKNTVDLDMFSQSALSLSLYLHSFLR